MFESSFMTLYMTCQTGCFWIPTICQDYKPWNKNWVKKNIINFWYLGRSCAPPLTFQLKILG